ncbi:MAG: hypothetical protein LBE04_05055 [Prevotellaceae bacterium]|jgi:hypothetical protein|nr:hypothetical protein [Prevotellaceae bacterium]
MDKELTREERLEIEEQAINALLQLGVKFQTPLKIAVRKPPKWIYFWNKHFPNHVKVWRDKRIPKDWDVEIKEIVDVNLGKTKEAYMRNFHIKPLYGGTICILRKLYLQIEIENPDKVEKDVFRFWETMAEIAAVAIINNPTIVNNTETRRLQRFLINNMTTPLLQKLVTIIAQMMDAAGFTNSIRLIQGAGITLPKASRIE